MNRSVSAFAAAMALCLASTANVFAQSATALEAELISITDELAEVDGLFDQYEGGLIGSLVEGRRQALLLSKALLENRLAAERGEAQIEISLPAVAPDAGRASEIVAEIVELQARIEETEKEADAAGGLVQVLALSRLETERLTLAQLQMAYYQANYGIAFPAVDAGRVAASTSASTNEAIEDREVISSGPEWADTRFPDIDYSLAPFQLAHEEGDEISGWWTIETDVAVIDDSTTIIAFNHSAYQPRTYGNVTALMARCSEGETALIMVQDQFLTSEFRTSGLPTAYRIDQQPTVESRWNTLVSNQGVGLFGQQAEQFIRNIYDAERLFIRVTDSRNRRVDVNFDLAGGQQAFDKVASACGWTTLDLSREDYLAIQTLLSAGGYDAGTPDGIWGEGSRRAMAAYQADQGLPETGAPDRSTLETLGY